MKILPKFIRSAFFYTAANLLNAIVPILLLPVLTSFLTKEDYGLVSIFQVLVMIMLPLTGLNAHAAVEREYFNKKHTFATYTSSAVYLQLVSSIITAAGLLMFGASISRWIEFPQPYLWMIAVYCLCHNLSEVLLSIWRVENRALNYGIFRISRTVLELGLSVALVSVFSQGWLGRIQGMILAAAISSLVAITLFFKKGFFRIKVDSNSVKDIVRFGIPLVPHVLGGVVIIYSDRIFITKMVSLEETGSYTVGYQVAMAIALLQSSFNLAWVPWFYEKLQLNQHADKIKFVRFTYLYNAFLLVSSVALTLASPLLFQLFINASYVDSIQFVFWIALAFAFDGMYKMVVNYIFFLKKTYLVSIITFATAALNLLLNFYFIKLYGAVGAAKATALCMFLQFITVWIISNRQYPMPWFGAFYPKINQREQQKEH